MLGKVADSLIHYPARYCYRRFWKFPGMANMMRIAKAYNRIRYRRLRRIHDESFKCRMEELLEENGWSGPRKAGVRIEDGWAIDTSGSLPHLDALLESADEVIAERGGANRLEAPNTQQPFFFNLFEDGDFERYPAFLDFGTSSEILQSACGYMKTIPVLARTVPPGIRFNESTSRYDKWADGPWRESQIYHLDIHDSPLVYIIVTIRDYYRRKWSLVLSARICVRCGGGQTQIRVDRPALPDPR